MIVNIDIYEPAIKNDINYTQYENPCARCMNNPANNPLASGTCCCSLPEMYMKGTPINSNRWMYETTTTTTTRTTCI